MAEYKKGADAAERVPLRDPFEKLNVDATLLGQVKEKFKRMQELDLDIQTTKGDIYENEHAPLDPSPQAKSRQERKLKEYLDKQQKRYEELQQEVQALLPDCSEDDMKKLLSF